MKTLSDPYRQSLLAQLMQEAGATPELVVQLWSLLEEVELEWEVWGAKASVLRKLNQILDEEIARRQER